MKYETVEDVLSRSNILSARRSFMEQAWSDVASVAYPTLEDVNKFGSKTVSGSGAYFNQTRGVAKSRNIYDSVGVVASERLTAGLESLITPQAAFWHSFASAGTFEADPQEDEARWYETLRNFLFTTRYDPRCGFPLANQRAMRSMVGLGHGIIFVEEAFVQGPMATPCYYTFIPVVECYLDCNAQGMHDTNFRIFTRTARQVVDQFGKNAVSEKVRALMTNPQTVDNTVQILHAVYPCKNSSGWCSQYLEIDNKHEITKGYFHEFPYIIYQWLPIDSSPYAESPTMLALAELKSLQAMGRDALIASQQSIRPPLASAYSPDVPINMNPGAVNPKMIDPNTGRLLVQPILSGGNPNLFEAVMTLRREQVKDALYLNLWMSLSQNGQMSATEASIRAAEKGELLGPAASRVQHALAMMVERETSILERKGAFLEGSQLIPPPSLAGKRVNVRFTAPIDKLRLAGDAVGIQRTLETMSVIGSFDPSVFDILDVDETMNIVRDRLGAPKKMFKLPDVVSTERQEKAQQKNAAVMTQGASPVAGAALDSAKAAQVMQQIQQAGGIPTMPGQGAPGA